MAATSPTPSAAAATQPPSELASQLSQPTKTASIAAAPPIPSADLSTQPPLASSSAPTQPTKAPSIAAASPAPSAVPTAQNPIKPLSQPAQPTKTASMAAASPTPNAATTAQPPSEPISQPTQPTKTPSTATTSPTSSTSPRGRSDTPTPGTALSPTMIPFENLAKEFHGGLECVPAKIGEKGPRMILTAKAGQKQYLPGQPRIRLDKKAHNVDGNKDALLEYFEKCHNTKELDSLLPFMRYIFVQTPSYQHISPLHHQGSHAREIKVTENPGLHLVWYYELIFIKPIPAYFYSQAFWTYIKNADELLYHTCLGFIRSYYMLIQYEIDFHRACKLRLIPEKDNGVLPTYEEWCEFIEAFAHVGDAHVNRRYHYGELRLSRINRAAFFSKGKLAYFHIYPQWGSFLEHTLAPIITVFAICSVVLNSMQVSLAAIQLGDMTLDDAWPQFVDASLWFPIVVILGIAVILIVALGGVCIMGTMDLFRGNKVRRQKKRDPKAGSRSHGMVG